MHKTCSRCLVEKELSEFYPNPKSADGYNYSCKKCDNEKSRYWKIKNLEKTRLYGKMWRIKNPDRSRLGNKKWCLNNKEKVAAIKKVYSLRNKEKEQLRMRQWYLKNRKKVIAKSKEWALNNPEKIREYAKNSRLRNFDKRLAYAKVRDAKFPEKKSATMKVNYHVKKGHIVKEACQVCGSTTNIQGHHNDYSKPLDVIWLCSKHHSERHKTLKQTQLNS